MKRLKLPLLILAMAVGLFALVLGLQRPYARYAAEHFRQRLDTVSDRDAPILLRRAAALGESGIPVLAEALGSQRESVARAAKQILQEQLDEWSRLPAKTASRRLVSRRLAILAEALACRIDHFGPTAQADASQLATQILNWRIDSVTADRARAINHCETVFRTVALRPDVRVASPTIVDLEDKSSESFSFDPDANETERLVTAADGLAGGGLPISRSSESDETETPRMASTAPQSPTILPRLPRAEPLGPSRAPDKLQAVPEDIRSIRRPSSTMGRRPQSGVSPIGHLSDTDSTDRQLSEPSETDATAIDTIVLMRQLRSENVRIAADARAELVRRGFTDKHIELALRLFAPDPRVRKDLVRMLPGLQEIDALPWLLVLCRDADADVRLQAITLLATTGAPDVVEQVAQLARTDSDPRIRQQAQRLANRTSRY